MTGISAGDLMAGIGNYSEDEQEQRFIEAYMW